MRRLLLVFFPGDESWLWRRVCTVSSTMTLLFCIVDATLAKDSATVGQLVIGLGAVLATYTAGGVADDRFKRQGQGNGP